MLKQRDTRSLSPRRLVLLMQLQPGFSRAERDKQLTVRSVSLHNLEGSQAFAGPCLAGP